MRDAIGGDQAGLQVLQLLGGLGVERIDHQLFIPGQPEFLPDPDQIAKAPDGA